MAVVLAGQKQGDEAPAPDNNNGTGVTGVGLAYMPSSVPPATALLKTVGEEVGDATSIISPHDWRRLHAVDLDDMVTQYGIKASSTEVVSGNCRCFWPKAKEPFRYGAKDEMTTTENLPGHLDRQLDSMVASGRAWHMRNVQAQDKAQSNHQMKLIVASNRWRPPSALNIGAPRNEQKKIMTPKVKPRVQILTKRGPAMKLYLSSTQTDIERRTMEQLQVQRAFVPPEKWAGSEGERTLKCLEKRHNCSFWTGMKTQTRPENVDEPTPSKDDTQRPRCHSKKTSPPIQKQHRRILVLWGGVPRERRVLDRLAPDFFKQFYGWVDLEQVATPVLQAASGYMLGQEEEVAMSLKDAMRTVGFRPGYSFQNGRNTDQGMEAVRILSVLSRLVAYPANFFSEMQNDVRTNRNNWHCEYGVDLDKSQPSCSLSVYAERLIYDGPWKTFDVPRCLWDDNMDGMNKLLRKHGLAEPVLLTTRGGGRREKGKPYNGKLRILIYYESLQQMIAAMTALDGTMIGEYQLRTKQS